MFIITNTCQATTTNEGTRRGSESLRPKISASPGCPARGGPCDHSTYRSHFPTMAIDSRQPGHSGSSPGWMILSEITWHAYRIYLRELRNVTKKPQLALGYNKN